MRSLAAGFLSAAITDWHSAVRASEGMRLCTARQKPLSWRSYFDTAFALMKNTKIRGWENAEVGIGSQFLICSTVQPPNFGFLDIASSDSVVWTDLQSGAATHHNCGFGYWSRCGSPDDSVEAQLRF